VDIIRSQLEAEEVVKEKGGAEAVYHLYGNCLEDIVGLFEGFLKSAYSMSMLNQHKKEQAEERIQAIKGNFQRLFDASRMFNRDLNIDIFSQITQEELDFLNTMFNKRHAITHNLGLVDEKFQSKINQWQRCGEELEIDRPDVLRGLELTERIIKNVVVKLTLDDEDYSKSQHEITG
jgi:hypothetical protein